MKEKGENKELIFALKINKIFQEKISMTIQDQKPVDEVLIYIITWMKLENFRLSKISHTQKDNMI